MPQCAVLIVVTQHRLALTDFGHAEVVPQGGRLTSNAGTPGWQAPELFKKSRRHGLAVDMWSMGIMAVQLLVGNYQLCTMAEIEATLPVTPDIKTLNFESIFNEIHGVRQESVSYGSPREDFIRRCLECDPKKRITVIEALQHPYLNEPASLRQQFDKSAQETTAGWTRRAGQAGIQSLPEVLAPPSSSTTGKKDKPKPKKNVALMKETETSTSPYFKVTKSAGVNKRTRPDEFTTDVESRPKRIKVVTKKTK